jgi:carnosine N-methyltransferase
MLRPVSIPDILPSGLPSTSDFSLVAGTSFAGYRCSGNPHNHPGDFEEIYGTNDDDNNSPQSGLWDAILTCFFIDTVGS